MKNKKSIFSKNGKGIWQTTQDFEDPNFYNPLVTICPIGGNPQCDSETYEIPEEIQNVAKERRHEI
jgi:hypothetical protein